MKRSKETKTKKLTKDLKVSEEKMKKVKGGSSAPLTRTIIAQKIW